MCVLSKRTTASLYMIAILLIVGLALLFEIAKSSIDRYSPETLVFQGSIPLNRIPETIFLVGDLDRDGILKRGLKLESSPKDTYCVGSTKTAILVLHVRVRAEAPIETACISGIAASDTFQILIESGRVTLESGSEVSSARLPATTLSWMANQHVKVTGGSVSRPVSIKKQVITQYHSAEK